jgi:hypothetical protein
VMLSSLFCCFTFYIYIKDQFGVNFCITCEIGLFFFSWPWLLNFSTPFIEKKKKDVLFHLNRLCTLNKICLVIFVQLWLWTWPCSVVCMSVLSPTPCYLITKAS